MRRIWLFILLLALLIGILWGIGLALLPPRMTLADGTSFEIHRLRIGPFAEAEQPREAFYVRVWQELPQVLRHIINFKPAPGTPSTGQSYYTDSDMEHALHVWFRLLADGQPVDPSPYEQMFFLLDERGWLYASCGWARAASGRTKHAEQVCHSFSAFPRWDKTFAIVFAGHGSNTAPRQITLQNPMFTPQPATNWPVQPIPQTRLVHGTEFALLSFEPRIDKFQFRDFANTEWHGPPRWDYQLASRDSDGMTNTWHVVKSGYYDNYLNHSIHGLPPRMADDDGMDQLQWRIHITVVADQGSQVASNAFWELPPLAVPAPSRHLPLAPTNRTMAGIDVHLRGLIGPGVATFTNGVLQSMDPLPYEGQARSSSRSSQGHGAQEFTRVALTRPEPTLFLAIKGDYKKYYYSCRAVDLVSGDSTWLGPPRAKGAKPTFRKVYNSRDFLEWSCENLSTNRTYQFTLGVHSEREVDFFIKAPIYPLEIKP